MNVVVARQLIGRCIELQAGELGSRQHLPVGDRRAIGERDGADQQADR